MPHDPNFEELREVVIEEEVSDETGSDELSHLIVYNDDVNTFQYVIESFIDVLRHSFEQAEQLAILIHFKGKATVKTAPLRVLQPKKNALLERGLSAVIESGE